MASDLRQHLSSIQFELDSLRLLIHLLHRFYLYAYNGAHVAVKKTFSRLLYTARKKGIPQVKAIIQVKAIRLHSRRNQGETTDFIVPLTTYSSPVSFKIRPLLYLFL